MAKFSDIVAGTRAFSEPETIEIAPDVKITIRFRCLTPVEAQGVYGAARAEAKGLGVEAPEFGEPIYDCAIAKHTIAVALVDPDSKPGEPLPFFDGGIRQVEQSKLLTTDVIAYLFELWQAYSESVSIQKDDLNETTFGRILEEASVGNLRPFLRRRRGSQLNFTRSLAARHVSLLRSNWPSTSGSTPTPATPSASSSPASPPEAHQPPAE
ncbi:MAG TPA: hypothetical protein VGH28_13835 [Polyangiaceae bacterium]|jgi:hypothetical protein